MRKKDYIIRNVRIYKEEDVRLMETFKEYREGRNMPLFLSVLVRLGLDVIDIHHGKKLENKFTALDGIDIRVMTRGYVNPFLPKEIQPKEALAETAKGCKIIPFRKSAV